jgi:hypothetical protein
MLQNFGDRAFATAGPNLTILDNATLTRSCGMTNVASNVALTASVASNCVTAPLRDTYHIGQCHRLVGRPTSHIMLP